MKRKNIIVILISISFMVLCGCKEDKSIEIAAQKLEEGNGIEAFYYYLKNYGKENTMPEISRAMDKARQMAEIELISVFEKPERYGSRDFYTDDADIEKIRFIIKHDDLLRSRFLKYISTNQDK